MRDKIADQIDEMSEEQEQCRELCKQVLPTEVVDGDSYGVPGIIDLVEMLVNKIKELPDISRVEVMKMCENCGGNESDYYGNKCDKCNNGEIIRPVTKEDFDRLKIGESICLRKV